MEPDTTDEQAAAQADPAALAAPSPYLDPAYMAIQARSEALRIAHDGAPTEQVIERATAYAKFLIG